MSRFSHSEIVVIGDSFCACRTEPATWVRKFTETLTGSSKPARGQGYPGNSWWSTRRELFKQLKIQVPKILVICHTEPMRIPNNHNMPLNSNTARDPGSHLPPELNYLQDMYKDMANAAVEYYRHLCFEEYHLWAQQAWYRELDEEILPQYKIPCIIHLHCFPPWHKKKKNYVFKNGATINEVLIDYSVEDSLSPTGNHFTPEMNLRVGELLAGVVDTYSNGSRDLGLGKPTHPFRERR